jgi:D-alanyl-D-alanine carboxypeptidase
MRNRDVLLTASLLWIALDARGQSAEATDSLVRVQVARGFSGVVLVAMRDRVLLESGYGTARPGDRFWIASTAKQFTSAALLRLQEDGRLTLDDSIGRFIPAAPPDKRGITLRQLLAHSSGLGQSYVSEMLDDRETAVARILAEPRVDSIGARFNYSNNNYQLAVAIVEIASGMPYQRYVRETLWARAGLTATGFAGERGAPTGVDLPPRLTRTYWGGEGVFSSTRDLFTWYRALRDGRVMPRTSVETLFTPIVPIQEGSSALGWFVGKTERGRTRVFTRGNESFGANSLVYAYPELELVIIVLTHAGSAPDGTSWSRSVQAKLEMLFADR